MPLLPNLRRRTLVALLAGLGVIAPLLAGGLASPAGAEVRPICFPVLDPVNYIDSFGAPRNGHTHEGTDIMGAKMHRLVSVVSGVIVDLRYSGSGNNADNGVRIRGDDGYYYVYLHMNNDTPGTDDGMAPITQVFAPGIANGARVREGQALGFMGDSGNAESAGAHLHFEIRLPASVVWQAVAINSYDSLRAARRCNEMASPTHPYTALGGVATSDADAASPGPGVLDMFVRGTDNQLWHRAWTGTSFSSWLPIGGNLRSGPGAVSPSNGRVDVFARGTDDQLWHRVRTGQTWGEWEPLGGVLTSDPDASSSGGGQITVAVRGLDNAVWYRTYDGASWSAWATAGGGLTSGPALASTAPGTLDIYARGPDMGLWHRRSTGGTSSEWAPLGGALSASPDATVEDGQLHVVVRGSDGRLWDLNHATSTWTPISVGPSAAGPGIVSWGPERLDVVVAGADNALYQTWWTGSGW